MLHRSISPLHPSLRKFIPRAAPAGMATVAMSHDQHAAVTQIAIDVFTDCVNRGLPMQDALLAVYMTGAENALSATHDEA